MQVYIESQCLISIHTPQLAISHGENQWGASAGYGRVWLSPHQYEPVQSLIFYRAYENNATLRNTINHLFSFALYETLQPHQSSGACYATVRIVIGAVDWTSGLDYWTDRFSYKTRRDAS